MISVIIVTYNAELTISRCIDSIINQTYQDFELIIINDGSTDKTLEVINSYEKKDARIIKISRENKGVARSRQEGLEISKGEYTIFVDSDDWVEPDFIESLHNCAIRDNADMVICDMLVEYYDRTEYMSQSPKSVESEILLGLFLKELHGSLCNKLISKNAYQRTGVRFLPNLNCCEDLYIVMALVAQGISVAYCNQALYHYDKSSNNNSITNNWLDFDVSKRIEFIKSIKPFIHTDYQRQCYDDYIGAVAYTATASSKSACSDYIRLFKEFLPQIRRSNIPKFKKLICEFRLKGITIPTYFVKKIRLYIRNKNNKKRNG